MKENLKEIYDSLLQLQSEQEMTNQDIAQVNREFDQFIDKEQENKQFIDGVFLSSFASNLDILEKNEEVLREFKSKMPGYIIALAVALPMIPLSILVSIPFFTPVTVIYMMFLAFLFKRKSISEFFHAYVDYRRMKKHVEKMNTRAEYQQLLDMRKKANDLKSKKRKNVAKLENLKRKFIHALESEMQEKYQELGIDEKVKIESASLIDGSSAGISLEFKPPKDYLD